MSGNPWHKRYHSDALAGYMALTLEERGAYTTFLDMMYDAGEALVEHERLFSGYMGCSLRLYRKLRDALLAKGKLKRLADGKLTNSRFEKEVEKSSKTSRKRAENGSKGGKASAEVRGKSNNNNDRGQANASAELKPIPEARSQKPDKEPAAQPLCGAAHGQDDDRGSAPKAVDDPTRRERLLEAMGADPQSGMMGPNGAVLGRERDMIEADRWSQAGITLDSQCRLIADRIGQARVKNPHFVPRSFAYFSPAMEELASAKRQPGITRIGEGSDDKRRRWARLVG